MKKYVSLVLVVLMTLSMLPIGVSASGNLEVAAVKDSAGVSIAQTGTVISTVEGEIAVEFADTVTVDADTIDGITLHKKNGEELTAIKGAYDVSASANVISVKFGRLESGASYVLTLPEGIADTNGNALVAEQAYTFTAEDRALTNVTFTKDYTVEQGKDNLLYLNGYSTPGTDCVTVTADGYIKMALTEKMVTDGNLSSTNKKAIGVLVNGDAAGSNLPDGDFNSKKNVDNDKVYVLDANVKGAGTTASRKMFGGKLKTSEAGVSTYTPYDDYGVWGTTTGAAAYALGELNADGTYKSNWGLASLYTGGSFPGEADNWYNLRMVLRRDADGKLASDLYNRYDNKFYGTDKFKMEENEEVNQIAAFVAEPYEAAQEMYVSYIYARPERLLSVIKAEYAKDGDNGELILHMSDDVATADVTTANISVLNGEAAVDNFTVAANNDNRTITLAFTGGLGAGNYTADISKLRSSNYIMAYSEPVAFEVTFENANVNPYTPDPSVAEGQLATTEGKIDLTFGANIDAETVNGITLKKDNVAIKTAIETNDNVVTVKFGRLEAGATYVLDVPDTVMTAEETPKAVNAKSFTYTAYKEVLTETNFDNYTVAQGTHNLVYVTGSNTAALDKTTAPDYATVATASGDTYVEMKTEGAARTIGMMINGDADGSTLDGKDFNNTGNVNADRVYVIDADVTGSTGNYERKMFGIKAQTSSDKVNIYDYAYSTMWGTTNGTAAVTCLTEKAWTANSNFTIGSNGWWGLRMVLKRDADGKLVSDLYNRGDNYKYFGSDDYKIDAGAKVNQISIMTEQPNGSNDCNIADVMKVTYVYARPELMPQILTTEYDSANKKLILYMNDDIKESSIADNVKIKLNGTEVDGAVAAAKDSRTIEIAIPDGLLEGSTYTIDVAGIVSTAEIISDAGAISYTAPAGSGTAVMSDVKSGNLDVDQSKITLTFSKDVAADSKNNVTFTKKDGTPIKGKVIKTVAGNKIEVKFGRLEEGVEYKLTAKAGIKAADNAELISEDVSFEYTGAINYEVYQDFTGIEPVAENLSAEPYTTVPEWSGEKVDLQVRGAYNFVKEGNDTYIKLFDGTHYGLMVQRNKDKMTAFNDGFLSADNNVRGKVLATEVKVRNDFNTPVTESNKANSATKHPLMSIFASTTATWNGPSISAADGSHTSPEFFGQSFAQDENDWSSIRVVIKKDYAATPTADGKIPATFTLVDMEGQRNFGESLGLVSGIATDKLEAITGVRVVGTYYAKQADQDAASNCNVQVTEVKQFAANPLSILDKGTYNDATGSISIAMTDDVVVENDGSVANISIKDANENPVTDFESAYNSQDRTITISFPIGIANGTYTIDLNNINAVSGLEDGKVGTVTFVAEGNSPYMTKPVYTSEGKLIVKSVEDAEKEIALTEVTSVTVSTTINNKPENCVAFLAVYKSNGELLSVKKATIEQDGTLSATTETFGKWLAGAVKLFVWKDITTIEPLFAADCL